ncbi:MAG: ribosome small subunit-dependent GTPase A [Bacteroidota bacterium]
MEGLVIKSTGGSYIVRISDGSKIECRLKGKFKIQGIKATNPIAVGDRVEFTIMPDNVGQISEIKERFNYIIRKATNLSKSTHVLAANIDNAYLIATLAQPRTSTGFIDRFLVTAEAYHIPAIILINKKDLLTDEQLIAAKELLEMYDRIGYRGKIISSFDPKDTEELSEELKGKINLFSGHSGVGKSSLINSIDPRFHLKVENISAYHKKGIHTTTFAEMHELSNGSFIIDTPGIKEFGLTDFLKEEVALYFPEMKELLSRCQFYNCTHQHEPRCAVKEALQSGQISVSRYSNYIGIMKDEYFNENEWD